MEWRPAVGASRQTWAPLDWARPRTMARPSVIHLGAPAGPNQTGGLAKSSKVNNAGPTRAGASHCYSPAFITTSRLTIVPNELEAWHLYEVEWISGSKSSGLKAEITSELS